MIDCDWCATARRHRQSAIPDHIGMLHLCTKCVALFELQRMLRKEAA